MALVLTPVILVLGKFAWVFRFAMVDPAAVQAVLPLDALGSVPFSHAVAAIVTVAPIPLAVLLSKLSGDRMSWRWPFQKESVAGVFGLFVLLAAAACIVPVYHATEWAVMASELQR